MSKELQLPVNKLSYSSLTQLLRNPLIFKMKYILGVYDSKRSPSSIVGSAAHDALQLYYGGKPDIVVPADRAEAIGLAREAGLQYIAQANDNYIEYGKTGSREEMLKLYTRAINFYFAEEPDYHKIISCEEKLEAEIRSYTGDMMPLPASGRADLIVENKDGSVSIIDTKFSKVFTDYGKEDYVKIVQAIFMGRLVAAAKGLKAKNVIFREIKVTENKQGEDGKIEPQIRDWVVPLDHEPYHIIFDNLYSDVVKFLSNNPIFLPNLSDMFDGEQAGLIYAQGLINADMSDVEVIHKVRDVALVSKRFVSSRLDSDVNKHLLPEERIKMKFAELGIPVEPEAPKVGASIIQYRFKVSAGVKMATFKKYADDIAFALQTKGKVKIVAPIPGTSLVGIEVENEKRSSVKLGKWNFVKDTLSLPLGVDPNGEVVKVHLDSMPHLLIAGATGSGKSYMIHSIITALTEQMSPKKMKLTLIDPKRVELKDYEKSKHLDGKIIHEYKGAILKLIDLVEEMEERYKMFERTGHRNLKEYNGEEGTNLAYHVVVIDEFADFMEQSKVEEKKSNTNYSSKTRPWLYKELKKRAGPSGNFLIKDDSRPKGFRELNAMLFSKADKSDLIDMLEMNDELDPSKDANIESLICRLAQMGRAAGIHLIIATQSPRVDVISGLIKANFPTRIALTVSSAIDSQVILGVPGAESLSGKGDFLLMSPGRPLERLQGFAI